MTLWANKIIAVAIQKKFIKQECCKLWQFSLSTASSCLMLESNEMNANMQESKVIFNHLQYSRGNKKKLRVKARSKQYFRHYYLADYTD
jgi:hypothetical protein